MNFNEILNAEDIKALKRLAVKFSIKALVLVVIVLIALNAGIKKGTERTVAMYDLMAERAEEENARAEYERLKNSGAMKEAEACAKVIYGTARDFSEADQKAVVWCIINRVENAQYPDTVEEVCAQPQQFMGYSDDNPVIKNFYNLALEQLDLWHSGGYRPITPDYIFMSWDNREITLRTTYNATKSTRYWTPERG